MNRPLRHIAIFCGLLVLALLLRANWLQHVDRQELAQNEHNARVRFERFSTPRGDIIVGGKAITGSKETDSRDYAFLRTNKDGAMYAPVTGYASQSRGPRCWSGPTTASSAGRTTGSPSGTPRTS